MKSRRSQAFRKQFAKLPANVRQHAKRAYATWKRDPGYPGLEFKQVHPTRPYFSVRVGLHWRAVSLKRADGSYVWFWIGSHAEYDSLLRGL